MGRDSVRLGMVVGCLFFSLMASRSLAQGVVADESSAYYDEIAAGVTPAAEAAEGTAPKVEKPAAQMSAVPPAANTAASTWKADKYRHYPSLRGSTGLIRILEAGSGDRGTFGIGFHTAFFRFSNYLVYGDVNTQLWSGLHLRITPLPFLEIFASAEVMANHNEKASPNLYQVIGNPELGAKGYWSLRDGLTVAAFGAVQLKNPVGEVSAMLPGTSFDIGLIGTLDLAGIYPRIPLVAAFNAAYVFDNSAHLIAAMEKDRGGCGTDVNGDGNLDFTGCLGPVDRTALGINRNDRIRTGLGLELKIPYVSPMAEYWLEIPVNRQGFQCPSYIPGRADSCLAREGFGGMHQWFTVGARALTPMRYLAVDVAVDVGVRGWAPTVHELVATAPYRVMLGISYSLPSASQGGSQRVDEKLAIAPEPVEALPSPVRVVIKGVVFEQGMVAKKIAGAVVSYTGRSVNAQLAGADGKFVSYEFPKEKITVRVSAKGYNEGVFEADLAAPTSSADVFLECPLQPLAQKSTVLLRILDEEDAPIQDVVLKLTGPETKTLRSDSQGKVEGSLTPGVYAVTIDKEGYLAKSKVVEVLSGADADIELRLSRKNAISDVKVGLKQITIRKQIHFESNSDIIKEDSFSLIEEIAEVLLSHPEITQLEIQGHTDDSGPRAINLGLSKRRAQKVKEHLVRSGVEEGRLLTRGVGPDKPITPNVTAMGRASNRRVEFHIIKKKGTPAGDN